MRLLSQEHLALLMPLFQTQKDTLILSCLQGHMGQAWADNLDRPTFAVLRVGDFCFLAGDASSPETASFLKELLIVTNQDSLLIIAEDKAFGDVLQTLYGDNFESFNRYALEAPSQFDIAMLQDIVNQLPSHYTLCPLEGKWYDESLKERWSCDFISNFASKEDYEARGLGMVILENGHMVSGASSYSIYTGGIEIEIDTKETYRKQGLARVVGAALILAALEKGLEPHWDAANETSVRLAKKLGYLYQGAYTTYYIHK